MDYGVIRTFIYPVRDLARAKMLYSKLVAPSPILISPTTLALGSETKKSAWIPMATRQE